MTFFGKQKSPSLFDQQAFHRNSEQKAKRRKNLASAIVKLGVLLIVLIVATVAVIRLPSLYVKIAKPFNNIKSDYYKDRNLTFDNRTNILLANIRDSKLKELALASMEPGKKKVIVLKIDPATLVNGQDGPKKLSDFPVYSSGKVSNIDQLSAAVLEIVNYIPDGYIVTEESPDWITQEKLNFLIGKADLSPGVFLNLRKNKNYLDNHLLTNLSINEFYKLITNIKKIQPERFELIDSGRYKTEMGFIDVKSLVGEVGVRMVDSKITEGNYAVTVVNASGVDGLGQIMEDVVANLGVSIVQVSAAETVEESSTVFVNSKSNILAERLQKLLRAKLEKNSDTGSVDIKIVIGKDFGEFFAY